MKNRVYFFTGTGNSLKVAKDIAAALPACEVVAIHKDADLEVPDGYDRIGLVFPVYFFGLPQMVVDFIRRAGFTKEKAQYYFVVATPGGFSGKPIAQLGRLLSEKGIDLAYWNKIRMNANYLARYGSIGLYYKTAMSGYGKRMERTIRAIRDRETRVAEEYSERVEKTYLTSIRDVHNTDKGYNINDACTACGLCASVCPAQNITLENGRPTLHHRCESCMACLQFCPTRAINYEDKTQKRKRYTHPEITAAEISGYYGKA